MSVRGRASHSKGKVLKIVNILLGMKKVVNIESSRLDLFLRYEIEKGVGAV